MVHRSHKLLIKLMFHIFTHNMKTGFSGSRAEDDPDRRIRLHACFHSFPTDMQPSPCLSRQLGNLQRNLGRTVQRHSQSDRASRIGYRESRSLKVFRVRDSVCLRQFSQPPRNGREL